MTNINSLLTNITKTKDFEIKSVIEKNIITSSSGNSSQEGITVDENNTIIGYEAGQDIVNGFSNTLIGKDSGLNLISGVKNTLIGEGTGSELETGSENVFVGYEAGTSVTTGVSNTLVGFQAGSLINEANNNSIFGYISGSNINSGSNNSLFGYNSGFSISSGSDNSYFGTNSGFNTSIGTGNSLFGYHSGINLMNGDNNSYFGNDSGPSTNLSLTNTTAIGANTKPNHNSTIVLGSQAQSLNSNSFYLPSGSFFTRQSGYGTNTMTDFNSYNCTMKYNSTTGQVVLKENDSNKPIFELITPSDANNPKTLDLIHGKHYYIKTIGTLTLSTYTVNLPDPSSIGQGFEVNISLENTYSLNKTLRIFSSNASYFFYGNIYASLGGNSVGVAVQIKDNCTGLLFLSTNVDAGIKTGSSIKFVFIDNKWFVTANYLLTGSPGFVSNRLSYMAP